MIETYFSDEAADRAEAFINLLCHTKGEWAGQPFRLRDWQRAGIVRPLFGTLRKDDDTRAYRVAYVSVPRKNGKSELGAAIALYLLFMDREPGAEVYSAAADREQASIVFRVAADMVRQDATLRARCKIIDSQKRILVRDTGSFYHAISSEVATSYGYNSNGIVFDELHAQPNRDLWDVLRTSTGARRQPLIFAITTAGYDRNSICWEQYDYAKKIEGGLVDDPTFFGYIREAGEAEDWLDEEVWKRANPALGDFRSIEEMRTLARQAAETPALVNTFRRLYLNQWTEQATKWLDMRAWDACAGAVDAAELKGRECFAGLDLASTTDIAAFVLVFPPEDRESGTFRVLPFAWIPDENLRDRARADRVPYDAWVRQGMIEATPGNVIDYSYIKARIMTLAKKHRIREIAFDRWNAIQIAQELEEEGLTLVQFGQGYKSMSPPTKELLRLVLKQRLAHGGHPMLRWMANNLVVRQDAAGNLKPDREKSTEKIDAMVALIMAVDRSLRHETKGSVYARRGLMTV